MNKPMDTNCRLFVYGTLAPGRPNEHILAPLGGSWQAATINGKLYEKGWGAALGYPGIVLDATDDNVDGFLFESEHLKAFWPELDAFEGEGYERVMVEARLNDGTAVECNVYALVT
ncbi:gamma-glutamylcyclotransferase [Thalassotalea euphylliae]|uniref:gamma-glutamylcyclotransferase family protein n=1 Tax=Thalassotalea euphylliae TaxID=1655234 RepID=UPI00363FBCE1